ncbi:uncharacterized protein LOC125561157 [Nematostella vectensis]|uniref:uncharacterized protein LOC125561157 n=1 Tax=Nematostella vectensis TaxID=45351 RepID=UPI0020775FCF|nr:uncharacterized protein LOC125561157 [Nematostella vectensis]
MTSQRFLAVLVVLSIAALVLSLEDEGAGHGKRGCIGWTRHKNKCNRGRKRSQLHQASEDEKERFLEALKRDTEYQRRVRMLKEMSAEERRLEEMIAGDKI